MIQYRIWFVEHGYSPYWHPDFNATEDINVAFRWREKRSKQFPEPHFYYEVREYTIGETK